MHSRISSMNLLSQPEFNNSAGGAPRRTNLPHLIGNRTPLRPLFTSLIKPDMAHYQPITLSPIVSAGLRLSQA